MLSFTLYPHLVQDARLLVLYVLFNVFPMSRKKKKNMFQGNFLPTKHILNVITNVLANMLTLQGQPDICTQNFHLTDAYLEKKMILI